MRTVPYWFPDILPHRTPCNGLQPTYSQCQPGWRLNPVSHTLLGLRWQLFLSERNRHDVIVVNRVLIICNKRDRRPPPPSWTLVLVHEIPRGPDQEASSISGLCEGDRKETIVVYLNLYKVPARWRRGRQVIWLFSPFLTGTVAAVMICIKYTSRVVMNEVDCRVSSWWARTQPARSFF